jgi:PAS domain S-box-containing protein
MREGSDETTAARPHGRPGDGFGHGSADGLQPSAPPSLLASLVASLPDAVLSIDRTSTIVHVNDAAVRLFGFPRAEFVGRTLAETIIPRDLAAQHMRGMERFAQSGHGPVIGRRIDITANDRAGRRFPVELSVFLDAAHPGEIFHATIRETTDRVARDAVFTAERERLRQILDATADAWWDSAVAGGVTRFSESAAALLGCAASELPSCSPADLPSIHPDDRQRVAEAWRAHLEGAVGRFECTHRLLGAGGAVRWIRQRGRAVEFDAGRPTRLVGTIADVTEQQAAEERLRNAQKLEMLGLLASGFAHDLNNFLVAIRGHAALAATEPGISPAALESLASVQLATTKAKLLTTNMLSLGKPSAEAIVRFPIRHAIEETLELARPGFPRTVSISADLAGADGLDLELDPSAFQQAILNLLINARDAMPGGGRLRIEASSMRSADGGLAARVVVEDTGAGIPRELLARVFEPFFTTKPAGVGTGIGLAVVQQVVASARGTVSVESDVGRGTRFVITLPAQAAAGASSERRGQVVAERVLLVEAHEVLRPMLGEALRATGHAVVEAASGAHALRVAQERAGASGHERVSVLVLESGQGAAAGVELHARIESIVGGAVPVVFMSADPGLELPGARRPDMVVLQKPFEIGELTDAIERVVTARDVTARGADRASR